MRAYQLYLKEDNAWVWVGTIDAATHAEAFRLALLSLGPGDEDRPIRVEQDTEGAYRKPVGHRVPGRPGAFRGRSEQNRCGRQA